MTQDPAGFHAAQAPADEMQVCAANGAGGQAHNRIRWFFDTGLGCFFQTNVTDSVKNNSFHDGLSFIGDLHDEMPRLLLARSGNFRRWELPHFECVQPNHCCSAIAAWVSPEHK